MNLDHAVCSGIYFQIDKNSNEFNAKFFLTKMDTCHNLQIEIWAKCLKT